MATPRKTSKARIKVGVIGLGIIGARVAANLRGAGHQVYVWSRSPHSAPNFLGSVVEVADLCDVIQVFVSDDDALLEVVRTIAAALAPRHVFAVHATVSPAAVRQAASIVESQGARYLDAPFTGSKAAAQNKGLVYYVGGEASALEEARPVLAASSKNILHLGKVGDATILKIATNMLTATTVQTLAEMLALVRAAGIDEARLAEALENNGSRSGTSDLKLPSMIAGNFEPSFSLKHMLKDTRLALDLAKTHRLRLPLTEEASEIFADGVEDKQGDLDFSIVATNYDELLPPRSAPKPPEPAPQPPAVETSSDHVTPVSPPAAPINEAAAPDKPAPIGGDPAHAQPKKNTLRIIKDFFKPAQS